MDNIFKKHGFLICSLLSFIMGAIIFLIFFGYKILNPFYIDWLLGYNGDLTETYLGWYYFLHSPWAFPLGAYDSLSYPVTTSILNTDSIPLFAIFFKLFKNILPDDFQYWGIFTLLCYMLQSYTGMIVTRKFTKDDILGNIEAVLGGIIFCLMPYITIFSFWHSTVVCHFLIIACLIPVIYKFNLKKNIIFYGIIAFLSASITPYICAICAVILFIYSIYLWFDKKDYKQFIPFVFYLFVSIFVFYIIGALIPTSSFSHLALTQYSFNLNGFFNSQGFMRFFDLPVFHAGQMQGYAYFGLGILILIFISLSNVIYNFLKDNFDISKYKKEVIFVAILIILSVILALSPKITLSKAVLFEIPLNDLIYNIWSVFRSTGKFIWIADYVILTLVLGYIVKHFSHKICIILLLSCITIQAIDFSKQYWEKSALKQEKQYINKYSSLAFDKLKNENNIKYINLDKNIYDYSYSDVPAFIILELGNWARDKNIKFNAFYFARPVKNIDKYYKDKINNPFEEDIFIFPKWTDKNYISKFTKLKYFYDYKDIIIGRTIKIKGLEEFQIP